MRHVDSVDACEGGERECVWACVCMHCWSCVSETSEDADEEAHWSWNTRPWPQATEQRIWPCCFRTQPPSSGLGGLSYLCEDLCVPASCRDSMCCQKKQCDHTWWENLLEWCVFFVLAGICWRLKLQPNSSLITIKVIAGQPQKANCCVCTLGANCSGPTNPTNRLWPVRWCWVRQMQMLWFGAFAAVLRAQVKGKMT